MRHASQASEAEPLELAEGCAHLWFAAPDAIRDPNLLKRYDALLDSEERERNRRFRFEKDRHLHLVAHALARTALSRYAPVSPDAWRFERNAYGKPAIAGVPTDLEFNLAHTRGLIVCGVARSAPIGVDAEELTRETDYAGIGARFFSSAESEALGALPPERSRERFFAYWTLKESYIKARGMGLSIPLGSFSFALDNGAPIRITIDSSQRDDPGRWRFALLAPNATHRAALAVRAEAAWRGALRVRTIRAVPLESEAPHSCEALAVSEAVEILPG